eukprot:177615_1
MSKGVTTYGSMYHNVQQSESQQMEEIKEETKQQRIIEKRKQEKTKVFINGELHIERINTAEQSFTFTGLINFFWKGNHVLKREEREKYKRFGPRNNIWQIIDDEDKFESYAKEEEEEKENNEKKQKLINVKKTKIYKPFFFGGYNDNLNLIFGGSG